MSPRYLLNVFTGGIFISVHETIVLRPHSRADLGECLWVRGCCRNGMSCTISLDQVREAAGVSRDTVVLGGVIVHCGKQKGCWCWLYSEEKPLSNFYPMWLLMVGKNQACQYHPPPKRKEPRGLGRWTTREKSNQDQASQHWGGRGASRWESHHREMPSKPPLYAKPKSTTLAGRGLSGGIPPGSYPSCTRVALPPKARSMVSSLHSKYSLPSQTLNFQLCTTITHSPSPESSVDSSTNT